MSAFQKNFALKLLADILLGSVLCAILAFVLRLELRSVDYALEIPSYLAISTVSLLTAELIWKLPLRVWRTTGIPDLIALLKALAFFGFMASGFCFLAGDFCNIPRSVPIINTALAALALGGSRAAFRVWCQKHALSSAQRWIKPKRVLIVGAGEAGALIAREMLRHPEAGLRPVGFLDDDPSKHHMRIAGSRVFGPIAALPQEVRHQNVEEILIAIPSAPGQLIRRIVDLAREAHVQYRIVPGVYEVLSGAVSISQIREVDLADLLGREQVHLDMSAISGYLQGKRIFVTGAGGSIGSEIVRQMARFSPRDVLLLGRGENSLFELQLELKERHPELDHKLIIADVRDRPRIERLFRRYRPQVVFHAAAHKHVPLMEDNADQAILKNVGGTRNVAELALEWGVEHFVNISTDKAVNPTSIMGASKRIAEMIVRRCAARAAEGQHFVSVRFGNVLGSRGSVIPVFKRQIAAGGPVTLTHPDMKRYFMTIPEAARLVLQAAAMPQNGTVYVLDMGKPVYIKDLAEDLIQLSGFQPHEDIEIIYTGLRPGEKLFEEILTAEEGTSTTSHNKIYIANQKEIDKAFDEKMEHLLDAARRDDRDEIFGTIKYMVPAFRMEHLVPDHEAVSEKGGVS